VGKVSDNNGRGRSEVVYRTGPGKWRYKEGGGGVDLSDSE
jgi:hypothetical protein